MAIWRQAAKLANCRAIIQGPEVAWPKQVDASDILYLARSEHRQIFPRCQLVVHHGGAGTTQTTLRAGVPSVVVAHVADQFFWGDELRRLGVAEKTLIRRSLSAPKLTKAIQSVLNNKEYRDRAKKLSFKITAEDGVGMAVEKIESQFVG